MQQESITVLLPKKSASSSAWLNLHSSGKPRSINSKFQFHTSTWFLVRLCSWVVSCHYFGLSVLQDWRQASTQQIYRLFTVQDKIFFYGGISSDVGHAAGCYQSDTVTKSKIWSAGLAGHFGGINLSGQQTTSDLALISRQRVLQDAYVIFNKPKYQGTKWGPADRSVQPLPKPCCCHSRLKQ